MTLTYTSIIEMGGSRVISRLSSRTVLSNKQFFSSICSKINWYDFF